ncbi:sugar ABC transporter permease, partial [Bifidobacterium sp. 82T10]|nr:sugar ABC transporter permease [Bifidobacterium miconis]
MAVKEKAAAAVVDASGVVDNTAVRRAWPLPKRLGWHFGHYWQHWVMALPAMVFVFVFAYIPMYGIQLAFRDFVPSKGLTGGRWVGLKYFNQFFTSPMFSKVMINTIKISLGTLVLGFIAPI